ncbi:MAG: RnfABCDGE type electron transport complex subunit D, partial [Bacteroidales bacterium]|nr:RnfABCDGE type electron transport complex subunit D [Bacteroidales bacterium]
FHWKFKSVALNYCVTISFTAVLCLGIAVLLTYFGWLPVKSSLNNPSMAIPYYYHFVIGGFAFGAIFMATDPVSAAHTNTGKYIYGFLTGLMAVLIRVLNPAYPEGMMLAILLMNTFAPLIDHYVVQANINRRLKRQLTIDN